MGGTQTLKVDIRIIAATNKDLKEEIEAGRFREDLFYRLNVVTLNVPPLRDRREDIPLLADFFLKRYAEKNRRHMKGFFAESRRSSHAKTRGPAMSANSKTLWSEPSSWHEEETISPPDLPSTMRERGWL